MASVEAAKEIGGFNLEDYYLQRRNFGSAVYVHKRFLNVNKQEFVDPKVNRKSKKNNKHDKGQQFEGLQSSNVIFKDDETYKTFTKNDSVLDQTIKFAKNLIPLVIPPNKNKPTTDVYYTITPTKRSKKKSKKSPEYGKGTDGIKRSKTKTIETFQKTNKDSFSIKESNTCSSNSTLNDINNQSLCCTTSETSEKNNRKNLKHETQKCIFSESFEALATELTGDKINIHLMTDKDKNLFIETLKKPILYAIKEFISEVNDANNKSDNLVQDNNRKFEDILDKLNRLEIKLDTFTKTFLQKADPDKLSRLEKLSQDLIEDINSDNEFGQQFVKGEVDTVVELNNEVDRNVEILGCGEIPSVKTTKSIGVKANRCFRVPARYCWTDSGEKG